LHVDIWFSHLHLLKRLSFLHRVFLAHLSKISWLDAWDNVWIFYSNPFVFLFFLWP
jgi:hypothetical protein